MLGFGKTHVDITRDFCARLIDAVKIANNPEKEAILLASAEGTFKDKGWRKVQIRHFIKHVPYVDAVAFVIEGTYTHYRDDHPMSLDGLASFTMPWCITYFRDDVWDDRFYVTP